MTVMVSNVGQKDLVCCFALLLGQYSFHSINCSIKETNQNQNSHRLCLKLPTKPIHYNGDEMNRFHLKDNLSNS